MSQVLIKVGDVKQQMARMLEAQSSNMEIIGKLCDEIKVIGKVRNDDKGVEARSQPSQEQFQWDVTMILIRQLGCSAPVQYSTGQPHRNQAASPDGGPLPVSPASMAWQRHNHVGGLFESRQMQQQSQPQMQ